MAMHMDNNSGVDHLRIKHPQAPQSVVLHTLVITVLLLQLLLLVAPLIVSHTELQLLLA